MRGERGAGLESGATQTTKKTGAAALVSFLVSFFMVEVRRVELLTF